MSFGKTENGGDVMSKLSRKMICLEAPLTDEVVLSLKSGDRVLLSGEVYTARDAAHRRMMDTLEAGGTLPINLRGQILYYVGPTPAFGDHIIGSAGPTTALRMDKYTPLLYSLGLKGSIGKGNRSDEVRKAISQYKGIYFAALGGTGALLSKSILEVEVVAYPDLGTEAVHRLKLAAFPVIVINDSYGNDYYRSVQGK
jgi:fumarate hydratase subunit beta